MPKEPGASAATRRASPSRSRTTSILDVSVGPVSIDLNGFSIRGINTCSGDASAGTFSCSNSGSGVGILAFAQSLTVRNGRITGMGGRGIWASHESLVENVQLSHNGGLAVQVGWDSIVRGNVIRFNDGTTVGLETVAGVQAGINALVSDNTISWANGTGINLDSGRVSGNTLIDFAGDAVIMGAGLMEGNHVSDASGEGLDAGTQVGVGGNAFRANNGAGPEFSGGVEIAPNLCNSTTSCP